MQIYRLPTQHHVQHTLQQRRAASISQLPVTKSTARPSTHIVRTAASDQQQTETSSCPFAGVTRQKLYNAFTGELPAGVEQLHGPGWRVLPHGNGAGLPEPEGYPCSDAALGEFREMEQDGAGAFLLRRWKDFGPVFSWRYCQHKVITVLEHDAIRTLLQQGDSKFLSGWNPETMYAVLGQGTKQSLENPTIRMISRKMMAPGFSREAMRQYLKKIEKIITTQLEAWSAAGKAVDMSTDGKALSFEFSTELLVEFTLPTEQKADLKSKFNDLFQGMFSAPINEPGTSFHKAMQAKADLQAEIIKVMRQGGLTTDDRSSTSVFQYNIEARRKTQTTDGVLTEEQIAESVIGLIIAGNDTSGLGVSAIMSILPLFPDVMQRLRQEQQQLIAKHGPELTNAVLEEMIYGEAVIKEVLRVAPPAVQVYRKTLVDLEIGGKYIPKDSVLYLSFFLAQILTDPKIAKDLNPEAIKRLTPQQLLLNATNIREEFHPERWLAQTDSTTGDASSSSSTAGYAKPTGLLTFNTGPHICLGMGLFYTEAKVLLAVLARQYEMELQNPEEVGFHASFVTQLNSQPQVKFSKLQSAVAAADLKVAAR